MRLIRRAHRTILPHLALPLAASYVVIYRLQEASETMPIASNKSVINFMRKGWVLIRFKRAGPSN